MRAYRLVRARHAATPLDGEGARRAGGRWNAPGTPLVYCAASLSLAVLELLVHADPADLPGDLVAVRLDVPDALPQRRLVPEDLPEDWRRDSGRAALRERGARWLREGVEAVLVVPSVIVPGEDNLLINPRHPDAARITVTLREPFHLDPRLA